MPILSVSILNFNIYSLGLFYFFNGYAFRIYRIDMAEENSGTTFLAIEIR